MKPDTAQPTVVQTAPRRIWLDLGFDPAVEPPKRFADCLEVTWSDDNATGHGIEYVRADAQPVQQEVLSDEQIEDAAVALFTAAQGPAPIADKLGRIDAILRALLAAQPRGDAEDAARYRWLRDVGDATWRPFGIREGYSAAMADAAIDAARSAGSGGMGDSNAG